MGSREIKGRESGEERAESGRAGYGRWEVLSPLYPPTVLVKEKLAFKNCKISVW